jgi:hypothetical protein
MIDGGRSYDLVDTVKRRLAPADSFFSLSASCDGAFPARIADVLRHLSPKLASASERLSEAALSQSPRPFSDPRLPLPHPLDFEWRFTNVSIDCLLRRMNEIAGHRGKLLFVCTPAVALRAFDVNNPRQLIYASRLDDPVTASLQEVCSGRMEFVEVRDDLSSVGAAAALVDPPWYDDIALPLVTQALRGLQEGGGLLMGIPDRLSNCSSAKMLSCIASDAKPFGMECAQLLSGKLRYETPFFELNTLRHLGLRSVHPQWRTGRAVFGRRARTPIPHHRFPVDEGWREVGDGGWRMRLRRCDNKSAGSGLIRFDIRESVSRVATRAPAEECWTVGNRMGFAAPRFAAALSDAPHTTAVREIAEVERKEARSLVTDQEKPEKALEKQSFMLTVRLDPIFSV